MLSITSTFKKSLFKKFVFKKLIALLTLGLTVSGFSQINVDRAIAETLTGLATGLTTELKK